MAQEALYSGQGALPQKLKVYLKNSELSDIFIKVGLRQYPAHRLVLGAASGTLAKMMEENPGKILQLKAEATESEIEVFERMLGYMYTGEITFSGENIRLMIGWAHRLAMPELSKIAQDWLFESLHGDSMVGVIKWLRESDEGCFKTIKDRCIQTLAQYFEYITETLWLGLSADEVLAIIERSDLVVADEETVIKKVDAWLLGHEHAGGIKELYEKMASKIRLPLVGAAKLVSLTKTSPLVQFVDKECPHLLSKAYKFRALCSEMGYDEDPTGQGECFPLCKNTQPRLYLNAASFTQQRHSHHSRGSEDEKFQPLLVDSVTKVWCSIQMKNGLWMHTFQGMLVKLESQKSDDVEVWRAKYNIILHNGLCNDECGYYETPRARIQHKGKYYRIAIVTTNSDEDAEFYLLDNPVVTVCQGSFQEVSNLVEVSNCYHGESHHVVTVRTPPIFAGKKPARIKAMSCIYISNKDDDIHE
ncbi:kelch-like protein 4 [Diadema antillarum]|uniref:kelch-like protein 4 n=1 Tax=Diadema antillarum TaxID=105358 RepID=UPI003A83FB03